MIFSLIINLMFLHLDYDVNIIITICCTVMRPWRVRGVKNRVSSSPLLISVPLYWPRKLACESL